MVRRRASAVLPQSSQDRTATRAAGRPAVDPKATRSSTRRRVATMKVRSSAVLMNAKIEKGSAIENASECDGVSPCSTANDSAEKAMETEVALAESQLGSGNQTLIPVQMIRRSVLHQEANRSESILSNRASDKTNQRGRHLGAEEPSKNMNAFKMAVGKDKCTHEVQTSFAKEDRLIQSVIPVQKTDREKRSARQNPRDTNNAKRVPDKSSNKVSLKSILKPVNQTKKNNKSVSKTVSSFLIDCPTTNDDQLHCAPVGVNIGTEKNGNNTRATSRRLGPPASSHDLAQEDGTDQRYKGKNMIEWVASLCQIVQTMKNEQNESCKRTREKVNEIQEEVRTETEAIKNGFDKLSHTMLLSFENRACPNGKEIDKNCFSIPMDFIDACTAMVRYAYALSGQGKGSPLHLFPSRTTQENIFREVIRILLKSSNSVMRHCQQKLLKGGEESNGQEVGRGVEESEIVNHISDMILCCRIVRNGKESRCIFAEQYQDNEKDKNTVLDRLLDQRRRYHECVTLPLVLAWLRYSGFSGYDSSKAPKKQAPEVFEAAADAFERNENGVSPYYGQKTYEKCYQASCLALRSTSETFGENALGYVQKLIPDDNELTNVIFELESEMESFETTIDDEALRVKEIPNTYYPHQLAFVFTKISARLQSLSKCNVDGGRGQRKVEKGHARDFLNNTVNFDLTLRNAIRNNSSQGDESTGNKLSYILLGVPVLPLRPSIRKQFETALHGKSVTPVVLTTVEQDNSEPSDATDVNDRYSEEFNRSGHQTNYRPRKRTRFTIGDADNSSDEETNAIEPRKPALKLRTREYNPHYVE